MSACYRSLAEDLFASELTEEQQRNPKYKLQKDKTLTVFQRSWITVMLRKNLGDVKVGYYILNYGVPEVLNIPVRYKKVLNKALLQNMLDEFLIWHRSLLQYIAKKKAHPDMDWQKKLSDLNEHEWREARLRLKNEAKQRLKDGASLWRQKGIDKKRCGELSSTEKQIIEDYETNKMEYEILRVKKPRV